jgi:crossover junction endodeoxyribonuclease RusA
MMTVTLGWPSRALSPNARTHWAMLARAKKAARREAYVAAAGKALPLPVAVVVGTPVSVRIQVTFTPPNARRHDLDNLIASIKAHLDGISDAIGIDDSRWIWAAPVIAAPEKPGRVVVTLTPVEVRA